MTPAELSAYGRLGAHTSWAKTADRAQRTAPARAAFMARFERQVDPDGTLAPEVRAQMADSAMRAHMERLRIARMASKKSTNGK